MKKRLILLVLCVFSCLTLLGGCAAKKVEEAGIKYDETVVTTAGKFFAEAWASGALEGMVEEQLDNKTKKILLPMIKNLNSVKEEVGEFKSADETSSNIVEGSDFVKYEEMLEFEKGIVKFSVTFDENSIDNKYMPEVLAAEIQMTVGQKMEKAALNTVFGMGFIFLVLIFISLVISALSLIPKMLSKKEAEKATAAGPVVQAASPVVSPAVSGTDLSAEEITAVITAAIMAYTADHAETPADGLVVRSIRRKGKGAWKRA